jgi:hypothetical protein
LLGLFAQLANLTEKQYSIIAIMRCSAQHVANELMNKFLQWL